MRHCSADGNGVNGITLCDAAGVTFENNIVAHNGNLAPSYSSGVNLYGALGGPGRNVVRGNVSFENVDVWEYPTTAARRARAPTATASSWTRAGAACCVGNNAFDVGANVFRDPTGPYPDFRLSNAGGNLIDGGDGTASGGSDLGFDPHCVVRNDAAIRGVAFWQYAINYPYVEGIGGIAQCFRPAARSVGGSAEVGAYVAPAAGGCQFHSNCEDDDDCTRDLCGAQGQCAPRAIEAAAAPIRTATTATPARRIGATWPPRGA